MWSCLVSGSSLDKLSYLYIMKQECGIVIILGDRAHTVRCFTEHLCIVSPQRFTNFRNGWLVSCKAPGSCCHILGKNERSCHFGMVTRAIWQAVKTLQTAKSILTAVTWSFKLWTLSEWEKRKIRKVVGTNESAGEKAGEFKWHFQRDFPIATQVLLLVGAGGFRHVWNLEGS